MQRLLYSKGWISIGLLLASLSFLAGITVARAADLSIGGDCCADLEERIAELEATAARKGNRKMSLTVSGQISEELLNISGGGLPSHWQVQSNSNRDAQSVVMFSGNAQFAPQMSAGFILQVGVGGFARGVVFPASNGLDTNGIYVREEYVYIKSDQLGGLSIGKQELATYNITNAHEGNTTIAHTMLSFAPLVGPTAGSALDIWDGGITDSIKYKSPHFFSKDGVSCQPNLNTGKCSDGFWVEAAWANADDFKAATPSGFTQGNLYDVAIKYFGDVGQFEVSGQAGYRSGMVVDLSTVAFAGFSGLNIQDIKVWEAGGGVKHMPTGVFVNASYGSFDYSTFAPGASNLTAWEVQAGIEEKWTKLGKTTIAGQYAQYDLGSIGLGNSNTSYGLEVVQNLEGAATDVFLAWEDYQPSSVAKANLGLTGNVSVIQAGVRVRF